MKTKEELERDIVNITMRIHNEYPELSKFISEMPEDSSGKNFNHEGTANFENYYNSLEEVLLEYSKTHDEEPVKKHIEHLIKSGYPLYPASEDIYAKGIKEMDLNPENISQTKAPNDKEGTNNEKDFHDDMTGGDLDVPGSELDDQQERIGSEDEENNYYSIGGDAHNDLEEEKG